MLSSLQINLNGLRFVRLQVPLKVGLEKTITYFKEELIRQRLQPVV